MRPETVHLLTTLFRHGRGILNACEKFERTVPREHRSAEVATIVEFAREAVSSAEKTLAVAPIE